MRSKKSLVLLFVLMFSSFFFSCSKKITIEAINKPVYADFKIGVKKAYDQYGEFASSSFNVFYKESKAELDLYVNYKNKVLDSIGLLKNESWMIIQLNSHKISGSYEMTYLFKNEECFYYYLDVFSFEKSHEPVVFEKKNINSLDNKEVIEIYNHFKNGQFLERKKTDLEPVGHPVAIYRISFFENNRFGFYKIDARNYIINKIMVD